MTQSCFPKARWTNRIHSSSNKQLPASYQPLKVNPGKSGRIAYRRWICRAKLLLEAEQGNWTSLCRVALRKRSQKFSKSSSSSSDVFSNTAITSVVTMLYTTKNEACRRKQTAMGHPCPGNCLLDLKSTPHNNAFRDPSLGTREGRNMAPERLEMEEVALALSVESPDATRLPTASVLRGLLS